MQVRCTRYACSGPGFGLLDQRAVKSRATTVIEPSESASSWLTH
ncbi:hypothetical protein Q760_12630 [Cellulomonas cellasea DSM 20118]|uniref:Uncharacterized protein n=1 Tax=Cellulomonas cellasea DSM 20118 TaxID=1408250 RepID=A0A0A0BBB4_9CELL|nr:hypothetical protein Q760_12630 [Cellulomonas cellasea DSM 20118]